MKFIKRFEQFDINKEKPPVDIGTDMNNFNGSENNIKDFNTKKNTLLNIYMTYKPDQNPSTGTPVDLYQKLLSAKFIKPGEKTISFINPIFAIYSEFCSKKRQAQDITNTIEQKKKGISDTQANVTDKDTANTDIENLNKDIQDQTNKLNLLNKEISDLQKSSQKQITDNVKNLETSKKRITNLDKNNQSS